MAHLGQQNFCRWVKKIIPSYFENVSVCDIGSLDINGNNHYLFSNYTYVGVDVAEGKNVSMVSYGHEFKTEKPFDVVISTECLEHDRYWKDTLKNISSNLLRSGGLFVMTCATTGRPEHGTRRTTPQDSPLTVAMNNEWMDYYKNLTEQDFREALNIEEIFYDHLFRVEGCDLHFYGIKK